MISIKTYQVHSKKKINTIKLAEMTGLSKSTINNIDIGKNSPTLFELELIAKALGVRMSDLFDSEYK